MSTSSILNNVLRTDITAFLSNKSVKIIVPFRSSSNESNIIDVVEGE